MKLWKKTASATTGATEATTAETVTAPATEAAAGKTTVTLSLASHTNVGKTTLARTLLRRDVGEVLDQAHVTELSEAHPLIATDDAVLMLYDTPGFGDSVRLLQRLEREKRPVLWFLQQTWDRLTDRPLWCSQQAMLTVRDDTDVVLYLVNATEEPAEAGYVLPELELLEWLGRPVILLLNQTGAVDRRREAVDARRAAWREHVERFGVVGAVLDLDAFNRCWVQESALFEAVVPLLPESKRPAMEALEEAWNARNLALFDDSARALASYLATAAADRVPLPEARPGREQKQRAMEVLGANLVRATEALSAELLIAHGLEGTPPAEVESAVDAFDVTGEEKLTPERGALVGGILSGALSGLAADALTGGLSLGGGMIAGAILGALGGAGLARGYQLARGDERPEIRWSRPFLERITVQTFLRYLAIAHFGRGRGPVEVFEQPERWRDAALTALAADAETWQRLWKRLLAGDLGTEEGERRLTPLVRRALARILADAYPDAAKLLERARRE